MDFQRIILGATLAVVSYMLVLQWNEDYGTKPVTVEQVSSVSAYGSASEASTSDLPAVAAAKTTSEDFPAANIAVVETSTQGQLIHISTDVLNLVIDRGVTLLKSLCRSIKHSLVKNFPSCYWSKTPSVLTSHRADWSA